MGHQIPILMNFLWLFPFSLVILLPLAFFKNNKWTGPLALCLVGVTVFSLGGFQYQFHREQWTTQHKQFYPDGIKKVYRVYGRIVENTLDTPNKRTYRLSPVWAETPQGYQKIFGSILITVSSPSFVVRYHCGEWIQNKIAVYPVDRVGNPGEFKYEDYLFQNDIAVNGYSKGSTFEKVIIPTSIISLDYWIRVASIIRCYLMDSNNQILPEPYNHLANGVALGIRSDIPQNVIDNYMYGGIYHLLVVSGGNLMLLAGLVIVGIKRIGFKRRTAWIMAVPAILIYAWMVGWTAPVTRATVGTLLFIGGRLLRRDVDPYQTLGLAGWVILLVNPMALWDSGFQLSFMAVLGIVSLGPIIMENLKGPLWLKGTVGVTLAATLGTLPIQINAFHYLSIATLITNLIALPIISLSLPLSLISGCLYGIFPLLAKILAGSNYLALSLLTKVTEIIVSIPFSWISIPDMHWLWTVFYYFLMGVFVWIFSKNIDEIDVKLRKKWLLAFVLFTCFTIALVIPISLESKKLKVTVLDVGQGDSLLIETPNYQTLLVDGGPDKPRDTGRMILLPYLRRLGIRSLDVLMITHFDSDHVGGLISLLKWIPVREVWVGYGSLDGANEYCKSIMSVCQSKNIPIKQAICGNKASGLEPLEITVLNPEGQNSVFTDNEQSLVLKIKYNQTSVLLTGDLEGYGETELLSSNMDLKSDVLKIGHHGSKMGTTDEFLDKVSPDIAVISVGKNNLFHHPHSETLSRLSTHGIKVFRTDLQGGIQLISDGRRWTIQTTE